MELVTIRLVIFLWGIFVGGLTIYLSMKDKTSLYLNSKANDIAGSDKFLPEFKVIAIEQESDINSIPIARYTVINCFFAKKNNKNFKYQTFYFYDRRDKYTIGQTIKLC